MVDIVERTGKVLLSNELYANLAMKPFQSLLKYARRLGDKLVVCNSPSKSFNVSGSACGYGIMPNMADLKRVKEIEQYKYTSAPTVYSLLTLKSCYLYGKRWLAETLHYIAMNLQLVNEVFRNQFPRLTINIPEAGFSVLIDFGQYLLTSEEIDKVMRDHNIAMNAMKKGYYPNSESSWFKMVVASNRNYLRRFFKRFEQVVAKIESIDEARRHVAA